MTSTYPIQLLVENRLCVVIGGGEIAFRKAGALLQAGGRLKIIAPDVCDKMAELIENKALSWAQKNYDEGDIEGAFVVVAATDDEKINRMASENARRQGILINVVDRPELCSFYVPSIVRRGDLTLTVATGGAGPALSMKLRKQLEKQFGDEYADYLQIISQCRRTAKSKYPDDSAARMDAGRRVADLDLLPLIRAGKIEEAKAKALACV